MSSTSPRKRRNAQATRPQSRAQRAPSPIRKAGLTDAARSALADVYVIPGWAILPLRLFLGVTFIYAGLQKLTDPGFFTAGSRTYIGTQILSYAHGSPLHDLFIQMANAAPFFGALTIATEMTVGLLVLIGLFTRIAALIGMTLSFTFFLSASWNVYPFFFGSDIVFVMCWLTIVLAGPGALSLDPLVREPFAYVAGRPLQRLLMGTPQLLDPATPSDGSPGVLGEHQDALRRTARVTRREAVLGGIATASLLALALRPRGGPSRSVAAPAPTAAPPMTVPAGATPAPTTIPPTASSAKPTPAPRPTTPAATPVGSVGNLSSLPVNGSLTATDPKSGDPAVIIRLTSTNVVAYDAVCTHAGCTVQYDDTQKLLICPCHGGAYDPAHGAEVVAGPPPAPLTQLRIQVDAQGNIILS